MPKPEPKPEQTKPAPPPEPPVTPPAPPEPKPEQTRAYGPDCKGVTPELRAYVDKTYGPQFRIIAVGATQIIIGDSPTRAGQKVAKP